MKVVGKQHKKSYKLNNIIGKGAYGVVYDSFPYAIKEVDTSEMTPDLKKYHENEVRILKMFKHENIVRLYDSFWEGHFLYFVMEKCENNLENFMTNNVIEEPVAILILKQIVKGFKALYEKRVIHRDLKPQNILISAQKKFKIADFGLSKMISRFDDPLLSSVVGTPLYMSPQILEKGTLKNDEELLYSNKCDIWSLGIIFYELLNKTTPWVGETQKRLYNNVMNKKLYLPNSLSEWTKRLLSRMLELKEENRIGWEELFDVLLYGDELKAGRVEKKEQKKEEERKSIEKKREKILVRKTSRENLDQKLTIQCPDQIIKEIFKLQLILMFGKEKANKIILSPNSILSSDIKPLLQILYYFNADFRKALSRNFPFLKNI